MIHGVFEVKISEMADELSKILKEFLIRSKQIGVEAASLEVKNSATSNSSLANEILIESKLALPLQNLVRHE